MSEYEKLGAFFLGKEYEMAARKRRDDLVLYDSKDLTTHAVIIGMTGSGKTGLGIGLLVSKAMEALGRNPEARAPIQQNMVLGLAFAEALGIYALVVRKRHRSQS